MSVLKYFGFWKEYGYSACPSIYDASVDVYPLDDSNLIYSYMKNSPFLVITPDCFQSAFDVDVTIESSSIKTDGLWCWPEYTEYYFRRNNIQLPIEFINTVRDKKYQPVIESDLDFSILENDFLLDGKNGIDCWRK